MTEITDGMLAALKVLPAWGFPEGHNSWPNIEYLAENSDPDSPTICTGEDINALLRGGFATAVLMMDETTPEFEEADAQWMIMPTELGFNLRTPPSEVTHDRRSR